MGFQIEDIYGCTRDEYCKLTGITPDMFITMLNAEVDMLGLNQKRVRNKLRSASKTVDGLSDLIYLYQTIEKKLDRKKQKIKDIKNEFGIK